MKLNGSRTFEHCKRKVCYVLMDFKNLSLTEKLTRLQSEQSIWSAEFSVRHSALTPMLALPVSNTPLRPHLFRVRERSVC
jgi:hypothetical protein